MTENNTNKVRANRYADAAKMLSLSIARGTQHFDREHSKELFEICICGQNINPECELHKQFIR